MKAMLHRLRQQYRDTVANSHYILHALGGINGTHPTPTLSMPSEPTIRTAIVSLR